MTAVYLAPVYILVNIYIFKWLILWLQSINNHFYKKWPQGLLMSLYIFCASAMVIGFLLPHGRLERFMKLVGNYWMGVLIYIILTIVVADVIRLILRHVKRVDQKKLRSQSTFSIVGAICLVIIIVFSAGGVVNARIIHTTGYEVTIDKDVEKMDSLNVVLVADLHLGYNIGCTYMEKMVKKINAQNPDIVMIAGDIFDNEYDALDDPERLVEILNGIESKYGTYAVYGNHDIAEKILAGFTFSKEGDKKVSDIRMDQFMEDAGIILLRDEAVLIDDSFYLYGRPDAKRPGRGVDQRKTPAEITERLDMGKPILVMDHEPEELQELADAGVDLDLCGHTHDGQLFPGNITIKFLWENAYGYLKKDNMHNIVTSGVGLFGPNMRVGTKAEICTVNVKFQ